MLFVWYFVHASFNLCNVSGHCCSQQRYCHQKQNQTKRFSDHGTYSEPLLHLSEGSFAHENSAKWKNVWNVMKFLQHDDILVFQACILSCLQFCACKLLNKQLGCLQFANFSSSLVANNVKVIYLQLMPLFCLPLGQARSALLLRNFAAHQKLPSWSSWRPVSNS